MLVVWCVFRLSALQYMKTRSMALATDKHSPDGKVLLQHFKEELAGLKEYFTDIIPTNDKKINDLEDRVKSLEMDINKYENALDDSDQYECRDSLIL